MCPGSAVTARLGRRTLGGRGRFPHRPRTVPAESRGHLDGSSLRRARQGIGRALVERATAEFVADGADLLTVLTLGPSVPEPGVADGYAGTRRFYLRCGFSSVMEFRPDGWTDVALLLVRCLRHPDVSG